MVRRTTRFGKPKPKRRVARVKARPKRPIIRPTPTPPSRTLPVAFGLAAREFLGVPEERIAVRGVRITTRQREKARERFRARLRTGTRGRRPIREVNGRLVSVGTRPTTQIRTTRVSLDPFERSGITFSQIPPRERIPLIQPRLPKPRKVFRKKTRGQERFQRPARPERPPLPAKQPRPQQKAFVSFVPFQSERGFVIGSARGAKRQRIGQQAFAGKKIFGDILSGIEGFIEETPIGITQREVKRKAKKVGSAFDVLNLFG